MSRRVTFPRPQSPEFVERRRAQLEAFLQALVRVPRVMSLPDMLVFFQLTDRIAAVPLSAHVRTDVALTAPMLPNLGDVDSASFVDVSYAFAPGALGLRLKEGRGTSAPCFIAQFVADPRGGPGQAEKGGVLRVGDVLTRISGQSVADLSYDEVVALIREAPRPVTVHFRRYVPRRAPAHAQPAAHAHLDRADDPPLAAAVAQPAASAAGGGEGRDSAAGDADADAAGTKRSAVGELRVLDGGAMALPIGKHELTFPRRASLLHGCSGACVRYRLQPFAPPRCCSPSGPVRRLPHPGGARRGERRPHRRRSRCQLPAPVRPVQHPAAKGSWPAVSNIAWASLTRHSAIAPPPPSRSGGWRAAGAPRHRSPAASGSSPCVLLRWCSKRATRCSAAPGLASSSGRTLCPFFRAWRSPPLRWLPAQAPWSRAEQSGLQRTRTSSPTSQWGGRGAA